MKLNKKILGLIISGIMVVSMVGCNNTNEGYTPSSVTTNDDFTEYNVLAFDDDIEVTTIKSDETYYNARIKVKNNSSQTVSNVIVQVDCINSEGVVVSTGNIHVGSSSINGYQTNYADGIMDYHEDVVYFKISGYMYMCNDVNYTVDLRNNTVHSF